MLGFEVNDLAADHAVDGAGGVGDFPDDGDARLGRASDLRQHFVGLGLQGVSGEDGDGLAEGFVAGGTSAAQVVVIERGQIVVDQGIGVEHFERRAHLLDAGGQRPGRVVAGLCPAETRQSPVTTQCRSRSCAPLPCRGSAAGAFHRQTRCAAWPDGWKSDAG